MIFETQNINCFNINFLITFLWFATSYVELNLKITKVINSNQTKWWFQIFNLNFDQNFRLIDLMFYRE